jgi:hypothetical protein
MRASVDVLVVGAGPVGLLLACELQRQGVDYLLIERSPQRSYFCKALGVTPRTLELFETLGLVEEAIDRGVWLTGWTSFENGVENGSNHPSWEGLPYGSLALPQYDTERILEACLMRHGGVVASGVALTDFAEDGSRIKVRVKDASGANQGIESIRTDLLSFWISSKARSIKMAKGIIFCAKSPSSADRENSHRRAQRSQRFQPAGVDTSIGVLVLRASRLNKTGQRPL